MALTSLHVAKTLKLADIAALLAESASSDLSYNMSYGNSEWARWRDNIVKAAQAGELSPTTVRAQKGGAWDRYGRKLPDEPWPEQDVQDRMWTEAPSSEVDLDVDLQEIYRWLKLRNIDDADIPEAFQATNEGKRAQQEKPSHLLAIAALVELLTKDGRKNYNQNAIFEDIAEMGVPGLSKSNLEKLVAEANKALKEARKGR